MTKSILSDPRFNDEAAAYAYVEAHVWPKGRVCPHCGVVERSGPLGGKSSRIGLYKCYACRKPFTVKIGTIFEDKILNLALQGKDLRKLIVREVMGAPLPQVPANAPVERVTHLLSHESHAVFVEMETGKLEVLTKFDLMDTIAGLVGQKR